MSAENFDHSCDRLSAIVDRALYDRLAWERDVGPKLAKMVELAKAAFVGREEFELSEEGATRDIKRYVVKIHGKRVVAVSLTVHKGLAVVAGSEIERGRFLLAPGDPLTADPATIDSGWMADAFHQIFERISERGESTGNFGSAEAAGQ